MSVEKVAIITAGGSGMGAESAKRLAADGFQVAVLSSSGKGEALAAELGGIGVTGSNQSNDDLKRAGRCYGGKMGAHRRARQQRRTWPARAHSRYHR
jgi:NAD(P)-dependent dehydrogenase (short-subunit alcohol dehydrogenase family)